MSTRRELSLADRDVALERPGGGLDPEETVRETASSTTPARPLEAAVDLWTEEGPATLALLLFFDEGDSGGRPMGSREDPGVVANVLGERGADDSAVDREGRGLWGDIGKGFERRAVRIGILISTEGE